METSSFFIKNIAMFGSFPTQKKVEELEQMGVKYFIDLTFPSEKSITPYKTKYKYLHYPIKDRSIPSDYIFFSKFVIEISKIIRNICKGDLIYIHCKGGHGRSGILVSCLLCYIYKIPPDKALKLTTEYHGKRKLMREKWRNIGSPQTYWQKNFVRKMFTPLNSSNLLLHPVEIPSFGKFFTLEAAFHAYKDPTNKKYVLEQQNTRLPHEAKILSKKCNLRPDWETVKDKIAYKILYYKFKQNNDARKTLITSGLRPLVHGHYNNYLGKILEKIRYKLITEQQINHFTSE